MTLAGDVNDIARIIIVGLSNALQMIELLNFDTIINAIHWNNFVSVQYITSYSINFISISSFRVGPYLNVVKLYKKIHHAIVVNSFSL